MLVDPFADPNSPNPGVFVGTKNYGSGAHTILKLSSTGGDPPFSQVNVEELDYALTRVSSIVEGNDGLYAVGQGPLDPQAKNTVDVWRVRMSARQDQGARLSWRDDDKFTLTKGSSSVANSATLDAGGSLYVAGKAYSGSTPTWIVRRKTSGTWGTVFNQKAQDVNLVPGICFFPGKAGSPALPPAILTVGTLNSKWTVFRRQNPDFSGNWVAVDAWPKEAKTEATAYDAACDSTGNIYVVGCRGRNGVSPSGWVIRRSSDGGGSWITLLDTGDATGSWAYRVGFDAFGTVWVGGVINPTGNQPLWAVLRNSNPESPDSWVASASARIVPFDGTWSKGAGVAADGYGNVFLTGSVFNWTLPDGTSFPGERVGLLRISGQ